MRELLNFNEGRWDKTIGFRGNNGNKIGLYYNNDWYMLKFPPLTKAAKRLQGPREYTSSIFSEDIGCRIFSSLGFKTQETHLGTYTFEDKTRYACACKDFTDRNANGCPQAEFLEFAQIKNTLFGSSHSGYGTDLEDVLDAIQTQDILSADKLNQFFWNMFVTDAYIGNFDRHNGNWGFLKDSNGVTGLAPIFDCGSSLFPQPNDNQLEEMLKSPSEMEARVYVFPTSAIKIGGKKINYHDFLNSGEYKQCDMALARMLERIDEKAINEIIHETPVISDIRKEFCCSILHMRKENILEKAYQRVKNPSISLASNEKVQQVVSPIRRTPSVSKSNKAKTPEIER